ncbi:MAG TPA: TonB-dependent receptor [Rhodothermales bacterium]|nr:TonB-dependent receptor [Rhodothermales bacterium]
MKRSLLTFVAGIMLGLVTWAMLLAPGALAQSGKLAGRVTDENGEALPGATVLVEGTGLGTATDLDGDYILLRVPPGTQRVRFSIVGYQAQVVENVLVKSNQTTTLDATLREEVIQGQEVVVTAERPIVDVSLTSTVATISREEIEKLPVQELDDIVNLQAGVVDGHFRGGRLGEVQYQVNGVSVNNPYDNSSSVTLDRSVLQEVQVISGTFDAEYGQALSGVVNAVLRSGEEDEYEFNAETYLGNYVSPGNDSVDVQTFTGPRRVALLPHVGHEGLTTLQNFQASLSGPVPLLPHTTFLVNGQRNVDDGYLFGVRRFLPTDSSNFEQGIFTGTGDGAIVPMRYDRRWSFLGKLTHRFTPGLEISYQALGNFADRHRYNHAFRFNPNGTSTQHEVSLVHGFDISHTLSPLTYYNLSVRQNYFDYRDMRFDAVDDPRYFQAGLPIGSAVYEEGAIVQGVNLGRFVQRTNGLVVKGTVTSQATKVHLFKTGFEVQPSIVRFGVPGLITTGQVDGFQQLIIKTDSIGARVLEYKPVQGAAFVQDRVEWRDLRIRAGVRLEYFDANGLVPSDPENPANSIPGAPESHPVSTTTKFALAPRLGVSFPILSTASVFFSFGHFYQMPGLGLLFDNADYSVLENLQAGSISYGVMGNPNLKPEFTAMYEFGFKSELTPDVGLDINLFYKDIRDLLGVEFVSTYTAAEYARFTNVDFGGVRGFTLSLDQRDFGPVSTTLDYTYQEATGNSSDPRETANRAAAGEDPSPRQVPLGWDQRHTLNLTALVTRPHSYALTGIVRLSSGQPYTPTIGSGFGAELEENSGRKHTSVVVDVRAEKYLHLGNVDLTGFVRVFNLFDTHFFNGFVYADTGSPFYTLNPTAQRNPDPGRLFAPRRVEVGISLRGLIPVK